MDDTELDWVHEELAGSPAGYCAKCDQIKPLRAFEYPISMDAARRLGYKASHRVLGQGWVCYACRANKRKPLSECTRKELQNRIVLDNLDPRVAKAYMRKLDEKARAAMREAQYRRWHTETHTNWRPIFEQIAKEMQRCSTAITTVVKHREQIECYHERYTFYRRYQALIQAVRFVLRETFMVQGTPTFASRPPAPWWLDYVPLSVRTELVPLWEAIDLKTRVRLAMPHVINNHRPKGLPPPKCLPPPKEDVSAIPDLRNELLAAMRAFMLEQEAAPPIRSTHAATAQAYGDDLPERRERAIAERSERRQIEEDNFDKYFGDIVAEQEAAIEAKRRAKEQDKESQ